ncbi:uncharacterized protein LOC105184543 [Harpegnathos saltator]|uniref:uncharacterized protein LOC105184543 n=1 Tax=Harpegnathos saltator TaxID=610380 RepID=UPI00058DBD94|nr:uncharacterized protein LOC105184543 [Harpegnathos saltator]
MLGDRLAMFYIEDNSMGLGFTISKNFIRVKKFTLSPGKPVYLYIRMDWLLIQFRTLPLYTIPSLQGLCREVIFQHIKKKNHMKLTAANIKKLDLPDILTKQLTIHEQISFPKDYTDRNRRHTYSIGCANITPLFPNRCYF